MALVINITQKHIDDTIFIHFTWVGFISTLVRHIASAIKVSGHTCGKEIYRRLSSSFTVRIIACTTFITKATEYKSISSLKGCLKLGAA